MWPFFLFPAWFSSSQLTADLLRVVSDGNSRAFNGSGATRAVALDISKAFDKVWHIGFLHNLNLMKFQVKYLALFCLLSVKDGFWLFHIGSLYFNTGVFQASILGFTLFLLYINELPNDVICNIAVYADDTSLYSLSVIRHLICGNNLNWLQNLNLIYDTVGWGRKWLFDFNAEKTQLFSFDRSSNTGAIDVKMDGPVLEEKSSFKMLGLTFPSKLDWGSYIISIAKSTSKKNLKL